MIDPLDIISIIGGLAVNSIFASKLYRSSKYKDKIQSAINNPINAELVQQLREYLDEDYVDTQHVDLDNHSNGPIKPKSTIGDSISKSSESNAPSSAHFDSSPSTPSAGQSTETSDDEDSDNENLDSSDISTETVEEPTHSSKSTVSAQTVLYRPSTICIEDIPDSVELIKGTLNSRDDTSGVARILCKDSELWVYYNDNVNLNNVMGPVIEVLNASGYTYLDFNRLARTDNAIVFQISITDTADTVVPYKECC